TRVGGFCWEVMEDHGRSSGSGREAGKLRRVVLQVVAAKMGEWVNSRSFKIVGEMYCLWNLHNGSLG
nr:hypothetical protein [Tanacetum cinerariifolium]